MNTSRQWQFVVTRTRLTNKTMPLAKQKPVPKRHHVNFTANAGVSISEMSKQVDENLRRARLGFTRDACTFSAALSLRVGPTARLLHVIFRSSRLRVLTGQTRDNVTITSSQLFIVASVLSICLTHISYVPLDSLPHAWFENHMINGRTGTMAAIHRIQSDSPTAEIQLCWRSCQSHGIFFTLVSCRFILATRIYVVCVNILQ